MTIEINPVYIYKAFVCGVYDGDTITADIDLGFKIIQIRQKIRLAGINTPEIRGPEREQGLIARDWLRDAILEKDVLIHTVKDKTGKYGRYLAYVWRNSNAAQQWNLEGTPPINQEMIELNLATEYK